MQQTSLTDALDVETRDLLQLLAERLDAAVGRIRVTLIFKEGVYVDGYRQQESERLRPHDLECRCRRHAWRPDCPKHGKGVVGADA
jgi:hypothetical protein